MGRIQHFHMLVDYDRALRLNQNRPELQCVVWSGYYRPNYVTNHCFKDDVLFVSFQGKIAEEDSTDGFRWFSGYDYALSGDIIESFVRSVKQYSSIDVSEIEEALEQKKEWYYVNHA